MTYLPFSDKTLRNIQAFLSDKEDFVFLETSRPDAQNRYSYIFSSPIDHLQLNSDDSLETFFQKAESHLDAGHYLAGWLTYELGHCLEPTLENQQDSGKQNRLANLGVFAPPIIFDHKKGTFNKELPIRVEQSENNNCQPQYSIDNIHPNLSKKEYLANLNKIKSYIEAGDTYQVNYTFKLLFDFSGSTDTLYQTLRHNQSVAYGAYIKFGSDIIQSFSPELFFKKSNATCTVRPMKGTITRGTTATEDQKQIDFLRSDIKNRSENVMIVDLLRNDVGRICKMGSVDTVSLFDIETYQTLHQMTSTIKGQLRPSLSLHDIFKALFPCGSVTGAPKIRTMEIINELENTPRGVYTGGIGFISPNRDITFNVPIRTLTIDGSKGEMGIGSGIVYDSDPQNEWRECLLKGRFLTDPKPKHQLIETILWSDEHGYWLLEQHMKRLRESANYFQYHFDNESIIADLEEHAEQWHPTPCDTSEKDNPQGKQAKMVRLLLQQNGKVTITHSPCNLPDQWQLPVKEISNPKTIRATISPTPTDPASPYLYHKTTIRDLYNRERAKALEDGFGEVIYFNIKGELTEGSISNILIRKGENFFTPPIACGLLAGTMRDCLLQQYPEKVSEKILFYDDLQEADSVYMINSIRGIIEIVVD